jgi:predicted NAD-dependent protein-ADP-ribosyltransferase YbiA (DUF1768 family)
MEWQQTRSTKPRPDVLVFSYYLQDQLGWPQGNLIKGERVRNAKEYEDLTKIPQWRSVLSNWAITPFCLEGLTWNTVEHYLQSVRSGFIDNKMSYEFSIESRSPYSEGDGLFAKKHALKFITTWQQEQWIQVKLTVLKSALYAKFSQNALAKEVLLNTNVSQLWYDGQMLERQFYLEDIREILTKRDEQQLSSFLGNMLLNRNF